MPKSKEDSPNRQALDDLVRGAQKAAALKAAVELELFNRLAEGQRTLPSLLRATGWNERGTRILLDALVHLGLLTKQLGEYALTPTSETYLIKGKPAYLGDSFLTRLAWEARGQSARPVRTGRPVMQIHTDAYEASRAERAASDWAESKNELEHANGVWDKLGFALERLAGLQVLGLSGGSALSLLALAKREPTIRLVLIDSAPVLAAVKPIADALGVLPQVEWKEGDPLTDDWPSASYGLAWLGGKTQYLSLEQNIGILRRMYESMVEGGRVLVDAPMSDDEHRGPGAIPLHGLDVLMGSALGDIYTVNEYRGMLEITGFFHVEPVADEPSLITGLRIAQPAPPLTGPQETPANEATPRVEIEPR